MRWSEKQLKAHLEQHEKRKSESVAQLKTKNDAKVRDQVKTRLKLKSKQNSVGDEKEIFESGNIILNGEEKPLKPAKLTILNDKLVHLEIVEGKYHQVKRMFAYTGNKVVKLHRLEFAGFRVDDLKEGEFRVIEDKF